MKRIIVVLLCAWFYFSPLITQATGSCSGAAYTIVTINGILNSEVDAIRNRDKLRSKFGESFNGQPLVFDYLYNPSHLGGAGDIIDVIEQGIFDQVSDYDLIEMIGDASEKIKTQKVLLVAHSQGNFYANNFYEKVASQEGGIPKGSIGVYGVATPAGRVAGGGKYVTSDTDTVIAKDAADYLYITLPPNIHIPLTPADGNGHAFAGVYLKYKGDRIISDIKSALSKLKSNDEQLADEPCISPPELTALHKIQGVAFAIADPAATTIKNTGVASYRLGVYIRDKAANTGIALSNALHRLAANAIGSLDDGESLATLPPDIPEANAEEKENPSDQGNSQLPTLNTGFAFQQENKINQPEDAVGDFPESGFKTEKKKHSGGGGSVTADNGDQEQGSEPEPEPEEDTEVPDDTEEEPGPEPEPEPEEDMTLSRSDLNDNGIADSSEDQVTVNSNISLSAGAYKFKDLIIKNGVTLTLEGDENSNEDFKGVKLITDNITIENGAVVTASGQGYRDGPGFPDDADEFAGPSYAGMYGSATEPNDLGTGGASNNRGGGAVWISVSKVLLNDGKISANGDLNSTGGSIWVETNQLAGEGDFEANGGGLYLGAMIYASGSGGRIAVYYDDSSWEGRTIADGGCGSYDGFSMTCAENGTVGIFDKSDDILYAEKSWEFLEEDGPFDFNKIIITNGAEAKASKDAEIIADELLIEDESSFTIDQAVLTAGELGLDESTLTIGKDSEINTDSIWLSGGSNITVVPEEILELHVKNMDIEVGSKISVDGKGYADGPGGSEHGASYGGKGWGGVAVYGSESQPEDFGSGGFGAFRGGGAVKLEITGSLVNDGIISANGDLTSSGGSIYVIAENISGNGFFQANGGGSHIGSVIIYGSGGGGRIAIYSTEYLFTGEAEAQGQGGSKPSQPGTVFISRDDETEDPKEDPDPGSNRELISSYTLNGAEADLVANPSEQSVGLSFTSSENVDWVSITIESEADGNMEKRFFSGNNCADWTNFCQKSWDGKLSGGGSAPAGVYRVKIHVTDRDGNEFFDYLEHTITVDLSITDEEEEVNEEEAEAIDTEVEEGISEEEFGEDEGSDTNEDEENETDNNVEENDIDNNQVETDPGEEGGNTQDGDEENEDPQISPIPGIGEEGP